MVDPEHAETADRERPTGELVSVSLPARTFAISAFPSVEISVTVLWSVSRMSGAMRPPQATVEPV